MRLYDVAVASLAIEAPAKWTDNLLSQHTVTDTASLRRGVARRISHAGLIRIALIRQLHVRLGVSVADGVRIAAHLLDAPPGEPYETGHLRLAVDFKQLERHVAERLAAVLESAPVTRRGRPAGRNQT